MTTAPPEPPATFPASSLPLAVSGLVGTVVLARVLGRLARAVSAPDWAYLAFFYVLVFGGLWLTVRTASRRHGTGDVRADLGLRWRPVDLAWGLLAAFLGRLATGIVTALWVRDVDRLNRLFEGLNRVSDPAFAVFVVAAVVGAPLFEELLFRGLLLRAFTDRFGAVPAVLLQGLAFGGYHLIPELGGSNAPYVLGLAAFGCVFGWFAAWHERLGPTVTAHAFSNALSVAVLSARR